jgi:hypothetical protein
MTTHCAGKTNTRDPRGGWSAGKSFKHTTTRHLRQQAKQLTTMAMKEAVASSTAHV